MRYCITSRHEMQSTGGRVVVVAIALDGRDEPNPGNMTTKLTSTFKA